MAKEQKLTQSETDGVQYRRAKTWRIALSQMNGGVGMCFYILMGYASYIASEGYGILTAVVGIILTMTRVLDGVTDPIIAMIIDKTNTKYGKIRIIMGIGWIVESFAVFLLFKWAAGVATGAAGVALFVILYILYVIGYTMNNVTAQIIPPVLSNDPKQRPTIGVWSTVYNYIIPMVLSIVINTVILSKYNQRYTLDMLAETCVLCVGISFVMLVLCLIGASDADRPENFQGISAAGTKQKVSIKDMIDLLKSNKPLQCYIVSAASDKLALQVSGQSIITTMLFGILMGNMGMSTILQAVAMFPSIIFAILGARYAGRHGNKESIVAWTYVCMTIAAATTVFFAVIDMRNVLSFVPYTVLFVLLLFGLNGAKMCVTTANAAMMADVIDYELDRSGKYLPAAVTATYSFLDKLISSLGATVATACVALIGYTNAMPQPTDSPTPAIKWMTLALMYFVPILGWVCTLCAMRNCPMSKEGMVEVQKRIAEKKEAASRQ